MIARPHPQLVAGDRIFVRGSVSSANGVTRRLTADWSNGVEVIAPSGVLGLGGQWRNDLWQRVKRNLPIEEAGITMGIVAGQQDLVPERVVQNMMRSGTLHMLATSGYNVFLLSAALMFVLSHLPVGRGWQILIALGLMALYADAVGGKPPVVRAVLMAGLFLGSYLLKRTPDALSIWSAAAITYLLFAPQAVYDAGFQLSFLIVFALILFLPPMFRRIQDAATVIRSKPLQFCTIWAATVLATTIVASATSAPLTAAHFGQFSIVAPVSNLLTAPAVPMVYLGAVGGQVLEPLSPTLARGADLLLTGPFSAWTSWSNEVLGKWNNASVDLRLPGWVAFLALALFIMSSRPYRRDPSAASP